MQPWQHLYDPAGNLWLSSLIALLPIAFFFWWLLGLVVGATSFRPQR